MTLRKKKLKSNSLNNSTFLKSCSTFFILYSFQLQSTLLGSLIFKKFLDPQIDPSFFFSYIQYIYIGWTELFYRNSEKNSDRSQIIVYFIRNSGRKRKAFITLQEFRPEKKRIPLQFFIYCLLCKRSDRVGELKLHNHAVKSLQQAGLREPDVAEWSVQYSGLQEPGVPGEPWPPRFWHIS